MKWRDGAEVEELSEPEFIRYADTTDLFFFLQL